jgi:hypothetical protein
VGFGRLHPSQVARAGTKNTAFPSREIEKDRSEACRILISQNGNCDKESAERVNLAADFAFVMDRARPDLFWWHEERDFKLRLQRGGPWLAFQVIACPG